MEDKSKLDQHFLKDKQILNKIIKVSDISSKDTILEIGPGKGVLTLELAKKAKKIIAVELDQNLKSDLDKLPNNVEINYGNILDLIDKLKFNKIISNIPYSISEPLFKKILKIDFEKAVFLTGENFFDLFFDEESKWSTIIKIFFNVKKIVDVPREAFKPKPKVNSTLFVLTKRKTKLNKSEELVKNLILQDDKKLKNGLMYSLMKIKGFTKNQSREKIYALDIPPSWFEKNIDYLSNKQFKIICDELKKV
jgi:16S rRNA (adenine1518-N6/adenine1519-N6)-dimethyltransferase